MAEECPAYHYSKNSHCERNKLLSSRSILCDYRNANYKTIKVTNSKEIIKAARNHYKNLKYITDQWKKRNWNDKWKALK